MKLSKKIAIAIIALVVIGSVGSHFVSPEMMPFGKAQAAAEVTAAAPKKHVVGSGLIYSMQERVLNLKGNERLSYLKISIALEFAGENLSQLNVEDYEKKQDELNRSIAPKLPLLNDAITTIVTDRFASELETAEGKERLREELKTKFNTFMGEPEVVQVYFNDFVMQ